MFTVEKAQKLLNIVYKECPSLQNEFIDIKLGKKFSVMINRLGAVIEISNHMDRHNHFCRYINSYLNEEFELDSNKLMFYNYHECFSFLHEVGHIYYSDLNDDTILYKNFKNKVHDSYKSAFLEYRKIPSEYLADQFASIVLKNRLIEIWALMNEITEEKAKEELLFWSEG